MATTTLEAIRTALETTLAGISLTNTMPGQRKLRKIPPKNNWDDTPEAKRDRGFMVGLIKEEGAAAFGMTSETLYTATFPVKVRHKRLPPEEKAFDRLNTDLGQIRETLEAKANFPTAVWLVRLNDMGEPVEESDAFWESTLEFRTVYSRALP